MTKTTFRPILFSTPMVQAILEGRKKMTRRTKGLENFNESLEDWIYDGIDEENDGSHYMEMIDKSGNPLERYKEVVPAYNVGDVLWVRETFQTTCYGPQYVYKANYPTERIPFGVPETIENFKDVKWKPSLFMPKKACRFFLKVKSVKVEKLQDISLEDIKKEGIKLKEFKINKLLYKYGINNPSFHFIPEGATPTEYEIHKLAWYDLWISINGTESWMSNPFVFVYEFERIDKPLDFLL